jgi:hypothetical protein
MEALQILKFIYKKERLDFSAGRKTPKEKTKRTTVGVALADLLTQDNDAAMDATDRLLKACSLDDSEGEDN